MRSGLLALMLCGWAAGQPPVELTQSIRQILNRTKTPAVSIAMVNRDGILWTAAIGKADLAKGRDVTPDTLFRIASISKGFTAFSVMMLVEQGKLSLDDSVRALAPDVAFENRWEATDPVRVVHLLEHTTGWSDFSHADWAHPAELSLADGLAFRPHTRTSRWKPGSGYSYCNSGAGVAAYIVQRITGKPFEDFVSERIFQPLGMTSASYFLTPEVAARLAQGYSSDLKPVRYWHISARPAGSINASVREMAAYVRMFLNRGRYDGGALVKPESIERIETPRSSLSARHGIRLGYALANRAYDYRGFTLYGHGGGIEGYASDMAYLPEAGRGYVCVINSGNNAAIGGIGALLKDELLKAIPKPPQTPAVPVKPAQLAQWTGYYEPTNWRTEWSRFIELLRGIVRVRLEGGSLRTRLWSGSRESTLLPTGENRFRSERAQFPDRVFLEAGGGTRLMVVAGHVYRRVPAVVIWGTAATGALCLLFLASTPLYALWWIPRWLLKRKRVPGLALRTWPLVAALSLGGIAAFAMLLPGGMSAVVPLGTFSVYSAGLFALTVMFPAAALLSLGTALRRRADNVSGKQRAYSLLCAVSACVVSGYLGYFGLLGLRTWR